ncbi:MAG: TIGR03643 family protein [Chryseobacterium sp.]|nr:TIGR03643 family protein [Chryseobacterium sp.]MDN5478518.1 TIGR03643 family protein [Chryseobacterium sp.]
MSEKQKTKSLTAEQKDRIIEMAWEDRTPFEAIDFQFKMCESEVIELMRSELRPSSFRLWRKRVNSGVSQKHSKKRSTEIDRFKCTRQRLISNNKISKR